MLYHLFCAFAAFSRAGKAELQRPNTMIPCDRISPDSLPAGNLFRATFHSKRYSTPSDMIPTSVFKIIQIPANMPSMQADYITAPMDTQPPEAGQNVRRWYNCRVAMPPRDVYLARTNLAGPNVFLAKRHRASYSGEAPLTGCGGQIFLPPARHLWLTHASAGNRTRVTSMATIYSATRPLMRC